MVWSFKENVTIRRHFITIYCNNTETKPVSCMENNNFNINDYAMTSIYCRKNTIINHPQMAIKKNHHYGRIIQNLLLQFSSNYRMQFSINRKTTEKDNPSVSPSLTIIIKDNISCP